MRRLAALVLAALFQGGALACGVCIDDKIASCYDHAVVAAARAKGQAVAFFAIEGDIVRGEKTRRAVSRAIDAAKGVVPGTSRVSLENAALSFAYDPGRASSADVEAAIEKSLGAQRLKLKLLRVLSRAS